MMLSFIRNTRWIKYALVAAVLGVLTLAATVSWPNGDDAKEKVHHMRQPLPSAEEIAKLPPDGGPEFNRLIHEKSPYLLQHARNPVDWYPWGDEAFDRAREEGKPIFLSVGYSTCHWCHVMERESFENEEIAALMNELFICIKVDREERPDVDEIYMTATQLMTGSGGWPMSVWLTHDRKPWYAGTYFPPEDRFGRPGFKSLLTRLGDTWRTRREDVDLQADQLSRTIKQVATGAQVEAIGAVTRDLVKRTIAELRNDFDERQGGFGGAPKFPPHGSLQLLLYEYRRTDDDGTLEMATRTLDAMALGGIHDHVGGGFHRYATDARWFLPHFEKMLYDNAQLSQSYVDAYLITKDEEYRRVAEGIYDWVLREMTGEEGGFYSALDADSQGEEGKFYLWSRDEVIAILGERDGELCCRVYNIKEGGNFTDEASGEMPGTSIAYLNRSVQEIAKAEGIDVGELRSRLDGARAKLLEKRVQRIWPHLDDKVLTSWNGLMIGSLAYGGAHLEAPEYIDAAKRSAEFILDTLRRDGRLLRTYRDGLAKGNAFLDDYAFLADGFLDLYEATGETRWLDEVKRLVEVLLEHYRSQDPLTRIDGGFFFVADDHENLLLRSKDAYDKAIPSGNGVAARVLVRLGHLTGEERYLKLARSAFDAFLGFMERAPRGTTTLTHAVAMYFDETASPGLAIAAPPTASATHPKSGQPDARARKKPVTAEAYASRLQVAPGGTVRVAIRLATDEGWHINSHEPLQDYLIATTVTLGKGSAGKLGEVVYPPGKTLRLGFSKTELSVYDGEVWLEAPLTIAGKAKPGVSSLTLEVNLQACDDQTCLLPETMALSIPVEVDPSATDAETRHERIFGALGAPDPVPTS